MERETTVIETKFGKNKIAIKSFLTELENRELIKILSPSFNLEGGEAKAKTDTATLIAYQDKLIEIWVVSIDGEKEKILDKVLNYRKEDFKQIVDYISSIGEEAEKKTK